MLDVKCGDLQDLSFYPVIFSTDLRMSSVYFYCFKIIIHVDCPKSRLNPEDLSNVHKRRARRTSRRHRRRGDPRQCPDRENNLNDEDRHRYQNPLI